MHQQTAFLFPGQGSQYVGMAEGVLVHSVGRDTLAEADSVLNMPLSRLISQGPKEELDYTSNTQPAVFAVSVAWLRILREQGITPSIVAGHSLGEYAAAVACGALEFADALRLVRLRGQLMAQAANGTGTMAAVLGLSGQEVVEICRQVGEDKVVAANFNAPGQVVVSGLTQAVKEVCQAAREKGARRTIPLAVSGPFHSPMMVPVGAGLRSELQQMAVKDPQIPMVVNYTAQPVTNAVDLIEALVAGVSSAVLWEQTMDYLLQRGVSSFVEVGPGRVLAGLLRRMDREAFVVSVDDTSGREKLLALRKGDVVR